MSVHTALGNACRVATWLALHNGGGIGFREVINFEFGLVLDGREESDRRAKLMI